MPGQAAVKNILLATGFLCLALCARAQQNGVPVSMVVTVEPQHGVAAPKITGDDITLMQDKEKRPVTAWTSVRDTGVQLWILIDDGSDQAIGTQFGELKKFINDLPAFVEVGLGYMRNGSVVSAQSPTTDHAAVAKAIRLPIGEAGISASPYTTLSDVVHKWPPTRRAREVLMISSGVDYLYGPGPDDPYLLKAIDDAQRAGVVVSSVYYGSAGHAGHNYWQITWGQNDLSELTDATGGEFFWQGMRNPVSLAPYLDQVREDLNNQFVLTFAATPKNKPELDPVRLRTEVPHVSLVAQRRVLVPAAH